MENIGLDIDAIREARRLMTAQEMHRQVNPPIAISQRQLDELRASPYNTSLQEQQADMSEIIRACRQLNDEDLEQLMDDLDRERGKRIRNGSY